MSEDRRELEDIFSQVLLLDPARRREILDQRLNGDERLRSELERMLLAYDQQHAAGGTAGAGRRFGAWQTTQLLARGGMGEVWLAERADGQHEQRAALKILLPYLAGPDSVDRFRRERQTLARLDHPNIAHLLDGGMSPQGEPYLVMEYVEGVQLDQYCDERAVALPGRLRLVIKVATAVHAAHQYFIIHRDLKPSNILVNRDGEPKLVDFGIAKDVDPELAWAAQTATTNLFLTPAYASPEALRGQPATVATDIYALGVVLYELLTGRRPFNAGNLGPAGLLEAITQHDAPRPSESARQNWKSVIAGDLDAIVLKALQKNPQERYASAAEFAADLTRYLAGEPVIAVPPSGWYIARTFIRRNRLMVAAAVVLLVSLAAGLAGTLWQAHVAREERSNAEQRFNDARKLANYVLFELYDSVGNVPGTLAVRADMARQGLEYLDRLASFKSNDPQLRLELAQGYMRLGSILGRGPDSPDSLGDNQRAIESDRKALAIVEPLASETPQDIAVRRTLANIEGQLGFSLSFTGPYKEAFEWLRKSADTFERIAATHPNDLLSLQDAGQAWGWLGKQLGEKGGYVSFDAAEPRRNLQQSIDDLEAALKLDAQNPRTLLLLAGTYESLGRLESLASPAKGIEVYSSALGLLDRLPEASQKRANVRELRAIVLIYSGWCRGQLGDLKTALEDLNQGIPVLDELSAADPKNALAAYRRVDAYRSRGLLEGYAGHKPQSLENLRKATTILDDLVVRDPANRNYTMLRAELEGRVANLLAEANRIPEARAFAEPSVAYFKKLGDSPDATPQQLISAIRSMAECGIESLRDYPAALRYALRANELAQGKDPAVLGYLAEVYGLQRDFPKAIDAAERGLAATPSKAGEAPTRLQKWLKDQIAEYKAKSRT